MKKLSVVLGLLVASLFLSSCAFTPTIGKPADYAKINDCNSVDVSSGAGYTGTVMTARSGGSSGLYYFTAKEDLHVYYDCDFYHSPSLYTVELDNVDMGYTSKRKDCSVEFDMKAGQELKIYYGTRLYRTDGTREKAFEFYIYFE